MEERGVLIERPRSNTRCSTALPWVHDRSRQFDNLRRTAIGRNGSFSGSRYRSRHDSRLIRTIEQNVPIYPNVEFIPDRNFDRRLDIQILSSDLRTGLADFL